MSSRRRLKASLARSQVVTTLRHARDTSAAVNIGRRVTTAVLDVYRDSGDLDQWRRTSIVLSAGSTISEVFATATGAAAITRTGQAMGSWVRESSLFRWLTKAPEPDVIVIDLRDTLTVAPIIALLDYVIESFAPSVRRSSLVEALIDTSRAVREAPIRAVSLVVLVSAVVDLLAALVLGGLNRAGVALSILLIGAAAVGTRVTMSWSELRDTRVARLIIAVLEPPEPIEQENDDNRDRRVCDSHGCHADRDGNSDEIQDE